MTFQPAKDSMLKGSSKVFGAFKAEIEAKPKVFGTAASTRRICRHSPRNPSSIQVLKGS